MPRFMLDLQNNTECKSYLTLCGYELLRLRKIKRNEARLAQLGLLVPAAASAKSSNKRQSGNADETSSALTTHDVGFNRLGINVSCY